MKEPAPTMRAGTGIEGLDCDKKILPFAARHSNHTFSEFEQPCKISDLLSQDEFTLLSHHLHNGNGRLDFVIARGFEGGSRSHYESKNAPFTWALGKSWSSMVEDVEYPLAVAVRSGNQERRSSWCAFDIDAHSAIEQPHAEWVLRKLCGSIRGCQETQDLMVLAENSGRGFHVWLISEHLRPAAVWRKLMARLMKASEINPKTDGIELFPSRNVNSETKEKALRLPGCANVNTWNPADGTYLVSKIIAERGLEQLCANLKRRDALDSMSGSDNKRGNPFIIENTDSLEEPVLTQGIPKPLMDHPDVRRVLERYAINAPSSRHLQLTGLIGYGFHHFSKAVLSHLAELQHQQASHTPSSSLAIHLKDFDEAYQGRLSQFLESLSEGESDKFRSLRKAIDREAFIIARNFAYLAARSLRWGSDGKFPLSGLELGTRLDLNTQKAYRARNKLITSGCIRKTEAGVGRVSADKFVWLLPMREPTPMVTDAGCEVEK